MEEKEKKESISEKDIAAIGDSFFKEMARGPESEAGIGEDLFLDGLGIGTGPVTGLGKYRVVKELGSGGMGTVYEGVDEVLGRRVAVKVLKKRSGREEARFKREAEVMAKLDHRHIAKVYTVGREGKSEYLVMEYVEGESLAGMLSRGRMERQRALDIGEAMCEAIGYAHERGIIHRDVKPENVLIERNSGRVVVVDFGLAKDTSAMGLTQSGAVLGTFRYMAPEQAGGGGVTEQADVYAIGAVLYEMLTGKYAVPGETAMNIVAYIAHKEIEPMTKHEADMPKELDRIVRRALAREPGDRQSSARELGKELKAYRKREERRENRGEREEGKKGAWRKKAAVAVAMALALGIWGMSGYFRARESGARRAVEEEKPKKAVTPERAGKERVGEMPEGWEERLWRECWNGEWVDFTGKGWEKLTVEEQGRHAEAYQEWYANKRGREVEEKFRAGGTEFTMRLIPPGRFWMGSPGDEADRQANEKRHPVIMSEGFWMQKTELTQRQWREMTGKRPWSGKEYMKEEDEHAAAYIEWNDVEKMLEELGGKWDFPSEAQWEYACRAGTLGRYYWGEGKEMGKYANVADRKLKEERRALWESMEREAASRKWRMVEADDGYLYVAPVGQLGANGFGLYDMIGNVSEWCKDWYKEGYPAQEKDPVNLELDSLRICRGGSWIEYDLMFLRAAGRVGGTPSRSGGGVGVRLVVPDVD